MMPLARSLHFLAARIGVIGALFLLVQAGGCLWWPDIEERTTVSQPPVIDRAKIPDPSPDRLVQLQTVVAVFSLAGAISDPDTPLEALQVHWYLGYPEYLAARKVPKGPDFIAQTSIRLNVCAFREEFDLGGGRAMLEAFVSDGPIGYDPDAGRVLSSGYAYVAWELDASGVVCP